MNGIDRLTRFRLNFRKLCRFRFDRDETNEAHSYIAVALFFFFSFLLNQRFIVRLETHFSALSIDAVTLHYVISMFFVFFSYILAPLSPRSIVLCENVINDSYSTCILCVVSFFPHSIGIVFLPSTFICWCYCLSISSIKSKSFDETFYEVDSCNCVLWSLWWIVKSLFHTIRIECELTFFRSFGILR